MTPLLLALAGLFLTQLLARKTTDDLFVRRTVVAAYLFKVTVTVLLYVISAWGLPILSAYQRGGGIWSFAWDSAVYHTLGKRVADALGAGVPLPPLGTEWPGDLYTGLIYTLLGAHFLHAALLNAWYGSFSALLAYRIARRFTADLWSRRLSVFLVAFWPSLVLWSTQLLKEPLAIFLILSEFSLFIAFWENPRGSSFMRVLYLGAAALIVFLLTLFRVYIGVAFAATSVAALLASGLAAVWKRRAGSLPKATILTAALTLAVLLGLLATSHDLLSYLSPTRVRPEAASLPEYLGLLRKDVLKQSGTSNLDPQVRIRTFPQLLGYLPRGLAFLFFGPFPWRSLSIGNRGFLFGLAGVETLMNYLFLPAIGLCFRTLWKSREAKGWLLLSFVFLLAGPLAVAVPNMGTLFRLRLQLFVPLAVLLASTESFSRAYPWLFRAFLRAPSETVSVARKG